MLTGELSVVIIIIRSTHIIKCRKSIKCNTDLPELFNGSQETENCLGAALQAAYKMVNKNFPQSSQSSSLWVIVWSQSIAKRRRRIQSLLDIFLPGEPHWWPDHSCPRQFAQCWSRSRREQGGGRWGEGLASLQFSSCCRPSIMQPYIRDQTTSHHDNPLKTRVRRRWWSCWTPRPTSTSGLPSSAAASRSLWTSLLSPGGKHVEVVIG